MTACIFLGPSLALDAARTRCPQALFLPPAEQGSLLAAVDRHNPQVIGIIDGYFRHRAAVWHKEILWALKRGIPVYGGASMGALRAVELEAFGMIGIGDIFAAYRAGALPPFEGLTDDDEVAVVHGPAETGYLNGSDALVNIRWTLQAARDCEVIDDRLQAILLQTARDMPFSRRRYAAVLAAVRARGEPATDLASLETWLPDGRIDQKAIDAGMLIDAVAARLDSGPDLQAADFELPRTELWHDTLMHGAEPALAQPRAGRLPARLGGAPQPGTDTTDTDTDDPATVAAKAAGGPGEPLLPDQAIRDRPVRDGPVRDDPGRDGPGRDDPERDDPGRDDPGRDDPERDEPVLEEPVQDEQLLDRQVLELLATDAQAWRRVYCEAQLVWLLTDRQGTHADTMAAAMARAAAYPGDRPAADATARSATDRAAAQTASLRRQLDQWRRRHQLHTRESIDRWSRENRLPLHRIDAAMAVEALRYASLPSADEPAMRRLMIERLKLSGDYAQLADRLQQRSATELLSN